MVLFMESWDFGEGMGDGRKKREKMSSKPVCTIGSEENKIANNWW